MHWELNQLNSRHLTFVTVIRFDLNYLGELLENSKFRVHVASRARHHQPNRTNLSSAQHLVLLEIRRGRLARLNCIMNASSATNLPRYASLTRHLISPTRRLLHPSLLLLPILLLIALSQSSHAASWGSVNFNATCTAPDLFDQHFSYYLSFQYSMARQGFQRLLLADPTCCIAHWAVALTRLTLLWGFPDTSTYMAAASDAAAAAACALVSSRMSPRERA